MLLKYFIEKFIKFLSYFTQFADAIFNLFTE